MIHISENAYFTVSGDCRREPTRKLYKHYFLWINYSYLGDIGKDLVICIMTDFLNKIKLGE